MLIAARCEISLELLAVQDSGGIFRRGLAVRCLGGLQFSAKLCRGGGVGCGATLELRLCFDKVSAKLVFCVGQSGELRGVDGDMIRW